jgi:hydrogenase nickel incorporation protein HypA/HybF
MHELFVTEQIRDIAVRYANDAGAARITALYLVIGELSSIVDDSVQFYWDFVSEGTVAAGATLHFRRLPARLVCQACGHQYGPDEGLTCPTCQSNDIRVVQGEEFYLDAIDVDGLPQPAGTSTPPAS